MAPDQTNWWELISRLPAVMNAVLAQTHFKNLGGLLVALENSGLGAEVASWLSPHTANLPISKDQLKGVLNDQQIQDFARRLGIPVDQALVILAQVLPGLVDKASPNGKLDTKLLEGEG